MKSAVDVSGKYIIVFLIHIGDRYTGQHVDIQAKEEFMADMVH